MIRREGTDDDEESEDDEEEITLCEEEVPWVCVEDAEEEKSED